MRRVFFCLNQNKLFFSFSFLWFLKTLSLKPLAFIVWDGRVGDDDLHVYISQIYFQMKTK